MFQSQRYKTKNSHQFSQLCVSSINSQFPIAIIGCWLCFSPVFSLSHESAVYSYPFDVSTLSVGYLTAYAIQLSGSAVICAIIYTINSLFFGICLYIRVLLLDLQQTFDRINDLYVGKSTRANTGSADPPTKRSNASTKFQSSAMLIRSFASIADPIGMARMNQATKMLKKFVKDHNDIIRWAVFWSGCILYSVCAHERTTTFS